MPVYTPIPEQDRNEPLDFSNLKYPLSQEISDSFSNAFGHQTLVDRTNALSVFGTSPQQLSTTAQVMWPFKSKEEAAPISDDQLSGLIKERPGINIPKGTPKFLADMMIGQYDNDKLYSLVADHPASLFGRIAAFGASMAGSSVTQSGIVGLAAGGEAGVFGKAIFKSFVGNSVKRVGAAELYGSASARIGTLLGEAAIEGGAAGAGFQIPIEVSEQQFLANTGQDHTYLQSLQNVGEAALFGAPFGALAKGIGVGLFGREIHEVPSMEGGVSTSRREGGLLNRPEFQRMPQKARDLIGKVYKPWSKDADITMREEATGQMLNGQEVNLDPVMKQGMADQGGSFRDVIKNSPDIDPVVLDEVLNDSQSNITAEIIDIANSGFKENLFISQKELFKKYSQNQFEESFLGNLQETIPSGLKKIINIDKKINELEKKLDSQGKNKQVSRRIEELEKSKPKILTPREEIHQLGNILINRSHIPREFEQSNAYKRLVELSNFWKPAKTLLEKIHKEKSNFNADLENIVQRNLDISEIIDNENVKKLNQLNNELLITQSIRDHLNNAHETLTQPEVQNYSKSLSETGIKQTGKTTELPARQQKFTVDDYLNEYNDDQLKSFQDSVGKDHEVFKEINLINDKIKKQEVSVKLTKQLTDCILKSAIS